MSLSDPIADMLTIVRNAVRAKLGQAEINRSGINLAILNVLKKERFIYDYKRIDNNKQGRIKIYIQNPEGLEQRKLRRIIDIQRVSKPGLRIYAASNQIPKILNGLGVSVLSTSKGVMAGREAKRKQVGGEVLLKVW